MMMFILFVSAWLGLIIPKLIMSLISDTCRYSQVSS